MRAIRILSVAALVGLDVSAASAQSTRHFTDSWFWGAKVGGMLYQVQSSIDPGSNNSGNTFAPLLGADWLITRKNGGLYVSFDYSIFDNSVFVNDSISPLDTVPRTVRLNNARRFTIAGMFFPLNNDRVHPYAGIGVAMQSIVEVEPVGSFSGPVQQNLVLSTINQFKTVGTPVVILGIQARLFGLSGFAQGTAVPANNNFFLWTQNGWRLTAEAGLRYNIGSSIDRMR